MVRKLTLVFAILALLLTISVAAAQDEENTIILPGLVDGEAIQGAFESTGDAQIYAFNGSAGDVVTIQMAQLDENGALDPLLVLLGEAGQVYAYNDDTDSDKLPVFASEIVNFELPVDGTYFVLATTFSGLTDLSPTEDTDAPYEYELIATGFTLPSDMEAEDVRYAGIEVEYGQSGTLEVTEEEPVFYVTFIGSEGDIVDIVSELGTNTDTLLYIFDPNGRRIAYNDDSDGLAAVLSEVELPVDGKYLIFATSYGFEQSADGDFTNAGEFDLSIDLASGSSGSSK